ncbi:MAG: hypothetical protein K6L81_11085 [Agarilytica sp.]
MDPVLADLIQSVSSDALKILGPAIIAALATYKATKAQYELKIREMEESHGFKAREALLQHYKDQKSKVDEGYNTISETIAGSLGMVTGTGEDSSFSEMAETIIGISDMYVGIAQFDIETTLRDMVTANVSDSSEYTKLESYLDPAKNLKTTRNVTEFKKNTYFLLDLYSFLGRCNQMLLEIQTKKLFSGYVKTA